MQGEGHDAHAQGDMLLCLTQHNLICLPVHYDVGQKYPERLNTTFFSCPATDLKTTKHYLT